MKIISCPMPEDLIEEIEKVRPLISKLLASLGAGRHVSRSAAMRMALTRGLQVLRDEAVNRCG